MVNQTRFIRRVKGSDKPDSALGNSIIMSVDLSFKTSNLGRGSLYPLLECRYRLLKCSIGTSISGLPGHRFIHYMVAASIDTALADRRQHGRLAYIYRTVIHPSYVPCCSIVRLLRLMWSVHIKLKITSGA